MRGGDYEVGYGKPPIHSRFKPGEVRPRRKPKPKGVDVCAFFDEKVPVNVEGQERQIHSFELAITNLAKQAITGNMRAAKEFLELCANAGLLISPAGPDTWPSVLSIPIDYDHDEYMATLEKFGPPPWPLEHNGMPRLEEYRNGTR